MPHELVGETLTRLRIFAIMKQSSRRRSAGGDNDGEAARLRRCYGYIVSLHHSHCADDDAERDNEGKSARWNSCDHAVVFIIN